MYNLKGINAFIYRVIGNVKIPTINVLNKKC